MLTSVQLTARLNTLTQAYARFIDEHQDIVENVAQPGDMEEQHRFAADVEETYIQTVAVFEQRLQDLRAGALPPRDERAEEQALLNNREMPRQLILLAVAFANSAEFAEQSNAQLNGRLERLTDTYNEFVREHRKISERAVDNDTIQENVELANNTQESYLEARSKIEARILEQLGGAQLPPLANQNVPRLADFRLESIKVHAFDGDYAKWNEWRALYDSLIHNQQRLSDTEKFHYLKRSLSGSAEQVLSGWHTTGENYRAAYDALVHVYDNSYRIVMAHLDALHKLTRAANETQASLRVMIDTTNRVIRQLRVAGSPVDHWDHFMVYTLVSRMAPRTLTNWETTQDLETMPTLETVLRFLERRARGIINLSANHTGPERPRANEQRPNEQRSNEQRPQFERRGEQASTSIQCYKCNGPHPIFKCDQVIKKTLKEKEQIIGGLKLCKNCLRKDHEAGSPQCRAGKCKNCAKGFHNSILCPQPKSRSIATVSTEQAGGSSANF